MPVPYKVGLTGGIGTGKSTVAELFAKLGVKVIDADKISHNLTQVGEPALTEIASKFGADILDSAGELRRDVLRTKIFNDKKSRIKLENLLHPKIFENIEKSIQEIDTGYCIVSIPLLLETGAEILVDTLLIVDCTEDLQIQRILKRDGITAEIAENIISNQLSQEDRLSKADEIIDNNNNIEDLENQVRELHKEYTERSSTPN